MSKEKFQIKSYVSEVRKLIGLNCWLAIAGKGTGSYVSFDFGKKIIADKILSNKNIPDDLRKYEGEFCLYIEDCAWRLESDDEVICGSASSNDDNGVMVSGIKSLIGKKVIDVIVSRPSLDLEIIFQDGLKIVLFCVTYSDDYDNYSYFNRDIVFIVRGYGEFVVEKRRE